MKHPSFMSLVESASIGARHIKRLMEDSDNSSQSFQMDLDKAVTALSKARQGLELVDKLDPSPEKTYHAERTTKSLTELKSLVQKLIKQGLTQHEEEEVKMTPHMRGKSTRLTDHTSNMMKRRSHEDEEHMMKMKRRSHEDEEHSMKMKRRSHEDEEWGVDMGSSRDIGRKMSQTDRRYGSDEFKADDRDRGYANDPRISKSWHDSEEDQDWKMGPKYDDDLMDRGDRIDHDSSDEGYDDYDDMSASDWDMTSREETAHEDEERQEFAIGDRVRYEDMKRQFSATVTGRKPGGRVRLSVDKADGGGNGWADEDNVQRMSESVSYTDIANKLVSKLLT